MNESKIYPELLSTFSLPDRIKFIHRRLCDYLSVVLSVLLPRKTYNQIDFNIMLKDIEYIQIILSTTYDEKLPLYMKLLCALPIEEIVEYHSLPLQKIIQESKNKNKINTSILNCCKVILNNPNALDTVKSKTVSKVIPILDKSLTHDLVNKPNKKSKSPINYFTEGNLSQQLKIWEKDVSIENQKYIEYLSQLCIYNRIYSIFRRLFLYMDIKCPIQLDMGNSKFIRLLEIVGSIVKIQNSIKISPITDIPQDIVVLSCLTPFDIIGNIPLNNQILFENTPKDKINISQFYNLLSSLFKNSKIDSSLWMINKKPLTIKGTDIIGLNPLMEIYIDGENLIDEDYQNLIKIYESCIENCRNLGLHYPNMDYSNLVIKELIKEINVMTHSIAGEENKMRNFK